MVPYHERICLCTSRNNRLCLKMQKLFSEIRSTAKAEANSVLEAADLSIRDRRAEMSDSNRESGACANVFRNFGGGRTQVCRSNEKTIAAKKRKIQITQIFNDLSIIE